MEGKIFDIIRKKYVEATPEEVVRQNFINFLIKNLDYPPTSISVERELKNYKKQRADIIIYKNGEPKILIECKAPSVNLNGKVFEQIMAYSTAAEFEYLILTNWKKTLICKIENNRCIFLSKIPKFKEL